MQILSWKMEPVLQREPVIAIAMVAPMVRWWQDCWVQLEASERR